MLSVIIKFAHLAPQLPEPLPVKPDLVDRPLYDQDVTVHDLMETEYGKYDYEYDTEIGTSGGFSDRYDYEYGTETDSGTGMSTTDFNQYDNENGIETVSDISNTDYDEYTDENGNDIGTGTTDYDQYIYENGIDMGTDTGLGGYRLRPILLRQWN